MKMQRANAAITGSLIPPFLLNLNHLCPVLAQFLPDLLLRFANFCPFFSIFPSVTIFGRVVALSDFIAVAARVCGVWDGTGWRGEITIAGRDQSFYYFGRDEKTYLLFSNYPIRQRLCW